MSNHETFHDYCKRQVLRLAGRIGWVDPKENPEPAKDLIATIEERLSKGSRDFAKRLVDACVESSNYCPTVADLCGVAAEIREHEAKPVKRPDGSVAMGLGFAGCEACGYSGWRSVTKNGYDYSVACACRGSLRAG
jgi:hypothetical protein